MQRQFKPKVLKAEFGDGYAQRAADGQNNSPVTLTLAWTNLSEADKTTIINFFKARKGYQAFYYTYEDETSAKAYVCEDWSYTHSDADNYVVNATFTQVFDV
jgi:phage-related protein